MVAISPDGSRIVYSANPDGEAPIQLYTRSLDQLDIQPIPETELGRQPFFSPGGEWIGFGGMGQGIRKISVRGGPP